MGFAFGRTAMTLKLSLPSTSLLLALVFVGLALFQVSSSANSWIPAIVDVNLCTAYDQSSLTITLENQLVHLSTSCFDPSPPPSKGTGKSFLIRDWQSLVATALYDPNDTANIKGFLSTLKAGKFSHVSIQFSIGGRSISQQIPQEIVNTNQNVDKIAKCLEERLFKQCLLEGKIPQAEAKKSSSFGIHLLYTSLAAFLVSFVFFFTSYKKIHKVFQQEGKESEDKQKQ